MKFQLFIYAISILPWHFIDYTTGFPQPITCGNRPVSDDVKSRIVGGRDAQPGSWPWLVSVQQPIDEETFLHLCGGSILNTHWVLTAAHCFKNHENDYVYSWRLVFGGNQLSVFGPEIEIRGISQKIVHETYDPEIEKNDVALLSVDRPIIYNRYIQPACLPRQTSDVSVMTDCYIAGWGVLEEEATEPSDILQEAQVQLIPNKRCNSPSWYNGGVGIYNLCAGYDKGGIDSCQGDSGGPLMCKDPNLRIFSVVGITSWGSGCAQARSPGVYSSTQYFLTWILEKIESASSSRQQV
ncbi:acrosin-like [Anomaloglossus baeobatrachus]|uniref:acrosin-like n=1 Tax=Anomaloglossus baeobatrachus TaxID=238106 RepID=UPI003F500E88